MGEPIYSVIQPNPTCGNVAKPNPFQVFRLYFSSVVVKTKPEEENFNDQTVWIGLDIRLHPNLTHLNKLCRLCGWTLTRDSSDPWTTQIRIKDENQLCRSNAGRIQVGFVGLIRFYDPCLSPSSMGVLIPGWELGFSGGVRPTRDLSTLTSFGLFFMLRWIKIKAMNLINK